MPPTSLMMRLDTFQQLVRQLGPVRGHEVAGLHGAQRHDVLVVRPSPITPTDLHRQEHGERLAVLSYQSGLAQLFDEDRVGAAQQVGVLRFTSPRMRTPRPGPGNGWRNTMSCGRPSARPSSRTSSLNSSRSGSSSFRCSVSGRPPTLWCDLMRGPSWSWRPPIRSRRDRSCPAPAISRCAVCRLRAGTPRRTRCR